MCGAGCTPPRAQRGRLGPRGVRLGRVEHPGVHPARPAVAVGAEVGLVLPRAARGARPPARPATWRPRRARPARAARPPAPRCRCGTRRARRWRGRRARRRRPAGPGRPCRRAAARRRPRSRSADAASRGRPSSRRRGRPSPTTLWMRAIACRGAVFSSGASASSEADIRTASAAIASPPPARSSRQRGRRALEDRGRVGAAQQRLGGRLRRRTPQAPVAQHHVDAVAGGGVAGGHALEVGQPGQGVGRHG